MTEDETAHRPAADAPPAAAGETPAWTSAEAPPAAGARRPGRVVAVVLALAAAMTAALVLSTERQAARSGRLTDVVTVQDLPLGHAAGPIPYEGYPGRPPLGGEHSSVPQTCAVYAEPVPAEHVVHSLEHGAVWVTYRPDLDDDDVRVLAEQVEGRSHRLLSPLPGQDAAVVLTAWGRQLELDDAEDARVAAFLDTYPRHAGAPEPGVACQGNDRTGRFPFDPPGTDAPGTTDA